MNAERTGSAENRGDSGLRNRYVDSSDDDNTTRSVEDGQVRRSETFSEASPEFKTRCKAFTTIVVLCIFLTLVFVPSVMGAT